MGDRKADAAEFHAEREQVEAIKSAVPKGARLTLLPAELDVSGGLPLEERPSLKRAVEGVECGHFAGIIVAYQSRLGRDTEYEEAVWRRVEAAGGRIIMALDGIDTATVDGKMIRRIRSAMNAAERERHAENFERRRREATAAGIWQRRQTPRGYRRDDRRGSATYRRLVPDEKADLVRWGFAQIGRLTVTDIADHLGMTTSGIRHMIRNRVYLGELRVGQHVNFAAHEPLVDVETFERAQVILSGKSRPPRGDERTPALLAGLVRCAACGHVMSRTHTIQVYYACRKRHSGGICPRPASINCDVLDRYVEAIAVQELERLRITAGEAGGGVAAARQRLADEERELASYLEAISATDVGIDAFRAGAQKRRAAVDDAREEVQRLLVAQPLPPGFGTGADAWHTLDGRERNALLRGLLEGVVVLSAGGRGRRKALTERVRTLAHGAGIVPVKRGEKAYGIHPLPLLDPNDERVLGMSISE